MPWAEFTQGGGKSTLLLNVATSQSVVKGPAGGVTIHFPGDDSYHVDQSLEEVKAAIEEAEGF